MNSERRKDCPMRHPENGNCLPAGGFCTAVNNAICDALHSAHMRGYVMASEKYTEVVHGRWEKAHIAGYLKCNCCKDAFIYEEWLESGKWNYCPNCGAKMNAEEA